MSVLSHDFSVMRQSWRHLLFAHWSCSPNLLRPHLPEGLELDTYEGRAWIGVVPFVMTKVRLNGWASVPGLSHFLELNVRTYVKAPDGTTGVWFFSLDCNQSVAVKVARTFFKLPYYHAKMAMKHRASSIEYICQRQDQRSPVSDGTKSGWSYQPPTTFAPAQQGSLDAFLVERYVLFSQTKKNLYRGLVQHEPYLIGTPTLESWDTEPLAWNGLPIFDHAPDHLCYSPQVDVRIFTLRALADPSIL